MVPIELLRPHPKLSEYFRPMDDQTYNVLKSDIEQNGVLTPLLVRSDYTIISGHRRYRASEELGKKELPVIFKEMTDEEAERTFITDNCGFFLISKASPP